MVAGLVSSGHLLGREAAEVPMIERPQQEAGPPFPKVRVLDLSGLVHEFRTLDSVVMDSRGRVDSEQPRRILGMRLTVRRYIPEVMAAADGRASLITFQMPANYAVMNLWGTVCRITMRLVMGPNGPSSMWDFDVAIRDPRDMWLEQA